MKGAVLALFCAVVLANAEINENGCPINPYVDVLIPHPNCNKFYQCLRGDLIERVCASNLVFNVETQECDWSENVDCEARLPPVVVSSEETEDSGNGGGDNGDGNGDNGAGEDNNSSDSDTGNGDVDSGNGDPSEASEICAADGSDGVLVAHEDCNQFYKCSEGKPVALDCPVNLLYNPDHGYCDWPQNVECDGRNLDGGNGGDDNGDGGNGDGGNGDGGNGEGGNGDSGNGGGDSGNNGDGGNSNPNEAPEICAADGSNGVLVAHENCNQFYKCSEGKPVALDCPVNLLYNPDHGYCDWPQNVDCDGRNLDGGNGGDDNGDGGNGDGGNGDGGNGDGGNGGDDNGNNGGGGNGNPSEAPEICAADGSDGVLVAHENCNQFYKCSEGIPVAFNCPANLMFDPTSDQCDWPESVDCGSRNRFASFNKHDYVRYFYRTF